MQVEEKEFDVFYYNIGDQVAEIFIKALPKERFIYLRSLLEGAKH